MGRRRKRSRTVQGDGPPAVPKDGGHDPPYGKVSEHACAECGAEMRLKPSRFGPFYGCVRWPGCEGTAGAHPDGRPLGRPADAGTKLARQCAHAAFDALWKGQIAFESRGKAYKWLAEQMGVKEIHIGDSFGDDLVKITKLSVGKLREVARSHL